MTKPQAFVLAQFVLFVFYGVVWLILPMSDLGVLRWLGVVLIAASVVVLLLSVLEHQRRNDALPNVTPTPNARAALVESGIYRRIRHPIYTAVLGGIFGSSIFHGNGIVMAMVIIFVWFFTTKSMFEESLLRQVYPEYAAYMRRSGRFLPFL